MAVTLMPLLPPAASLAATSAQVGTGVSSRRRTYLVMEHGWVQTPENLTGTPSSYAAKTASAVIRRGDAFIGINGGGGGLGDPLVRPVHKMAVDVRDGYVTGDHAALMYGVVLTLAARSTALPPGCDALSFGPSAPGRTCAALRSPRTSAAPFTSRMGAGVVQRVRRILRRQRRTGAMAL